MPLSNEPLKHDSEYMAELSDGHPLVDMYWSMAATYLRAGRWSWQTWWSFPA